MNTQTGQRSRDLPLEADEDTSDSDLAGLTSQSSSRSGTSSSLAFANGSNDMLMDDPSVPGFGLLRRTGTPDPWVKKLADDGLSYYYFNKSDGSVQWTRPEHPRTTRDRSNSSNAQPPTSERTPIAPLASTLQPQPARRTPPTVPHQSSRLSVYSDDSDIHPLDPGLITRPLLNGHPHRRPDPPNPRQAFTTELTSAERIAQSLQQALASPPPELVTDLSAIAKGSIQAVVDNIQLNGMSRRGEQDRRMDELIYGVVNAVRNLLYVSASPTGQIPSHVVPREARDLIKPPSSSQSALKPAQRKVTATLSRLVLSARAMQYDSGSSMSDTLNRIEVDAEELERAVLSFVLEVQRIQHSATPDSTDAKANKRLRGVFLTANVGLGLVGSGAAGSWKGLGWVSLDDEAEAPRRALGTEVVTELASYQRQLDGNFVTLGRVLRSPDETPGRTELHLVKCWGTHSTFFSRASPFAYQDYGHFGVLFPSFCG